MTLFIIKTILKKTRTNSETIIKYNINKWSIITIKIHFFSVYYFMFNSYEVSLFTIILIRIKFINPM